MAERRKGGKRKSSEQNQKLTKDEDCYARFVRFNCPTKTTMFEGNEVHYFTGSKAVDVLYESKKYGCAAKTVKFCTRQVAITFMRAMLEKGLFFRARKLVPKKKGEKKEKPNEDTNKSPKKSYKIELHSEKDGDKHEKKKLDESDDPDDDENKEKKSKEKVEEEKKKRKVKLELHQDQIFNDANDVYVWIFDPTPLYKKVIGALMVMGTVAGCLFPLWPMWLRQGVYYASIVGLACFGLLIGVAIVRTILFAIIWVATFGKHKLWILPNLTEDCGFFESFHPWYTYQFCPGNTTDSNKRKKKTTNKNSSGEENIGKDNKNCEFNKKHDFKEKTDESGGDECLQVHFKKTDVNDCVDLDIDNGESDESNDASDFENESNQGTTDESIAIASGTNGQRDPKSNEGKVRQRRRVKKTDDDFVLVDN